LANTGLGEAPRTRRNFGRHHSNVVEVRAVACDALRWVANSALDCEGGLAWPEIAASGQPTTDDVYSGTAGVLLALSEARLSGIDEFDATASLAAGRLLHLAASPTRLDPAADPGQPGDSGLYTGQAGYCFALRCWAQASGDEHSAAAASELTVRLASWSQISGADAPYSRYRDLLLGEAGVLIGLLDEGSAEANAAAALIANRLGGCGTP